jgi:hypothetical protein
MLATRKPRKRIRRKFSFTGNTVADDILIGNHGSASLIARGHFNLSGILYMLAGKADFTVNGSGQITFTGKCKHLVISKAHGDCILDFSELRCDLITCVSVGGQVTILTGETKRIDITEMNEEATLKISGNPLVTAHCLDHNARIVCPQSFLPPVVIQSTKRTSSVL